MKSKLHEFIYTHWDNWEELLTAPPYNLNITRDGDYTLFKYNQIESDFNEELVREARGIIFNISARGTLYPVIDCVCRPFDKFGNYGESYCPDIDWASASVQEKVDGSLIKVWYGSDYTWHISTNGSINAFTAPINDFMNFGDLFVDTVLKNTGLENIDKFYRLLNTRFTYMFELVSPYNRVVIPYETAQVYFLGLRESRDFYNHNKEFMPEDSILADYFPIPKRYDLHSLEDVIAAAQKLPWNEEGYVVCDKYFNRIKIKSPSYVQAHYMRNNNVITTEHIIEVILAGEEDEFLIYASEYTDRLQNIKNKMQTLAHEAVEQAHILFGATCEFPERKDYALNVMNLPSYMRDFLFHIYDDRIFMDYAQKWSAKDWAKYIKEGE